MPLLNQIIEVDQVVKFMKMVKGGTCSYVLTFEKDILYPNDKIKLTIDVDNTKCTKSVDKYKFKILRWTEVFDPYNKKKVNKPIYMHDYLLANETRKANCKNLGTEQTVYEFILPQNIFNTEEEETRMKVPLVEKPLA